MNESSGGGGGSSGSDSGQSITGQNVEEKEKEELWSVNQSAFCALLWRREAQSEASFACRKCCCCLRTRAESHCGWRHWLKRNSTAPAQLNHRLCMNNQRHTNHLLLLLLCFSFHFSSLALFLFCLTTEFQQCSFEVREVVFPLYPAIDCCCWCSCAGAVSAQDKELTRGEIKVDQKRWHGDTRQERGYYYCYYYQYYCWPIIQSIRWTRAAMQVNYALSIHLIHLIHWLATKFWMSHRHALCSPFFHSLPFFALIHPPRGPFNQP